MFMYKTISCRQSDCFHQSINRANLKALEKKAAKFQATTGYRFCLAQIYHIRFNKKLDSSISRDEFDEIKDILALLSNKSSFKRIHYPDIPAESSIHRVKQRFYLNIPHFRLVFIISGNNILAYITYSSEHTHKYLLSKTHNLLEKMEHLQYITKVNGKKILSLPEPSYPEDSDEKLAEKTDFNETDQQAFDESSAIFLTALNQLKQSICPSSSYSSKKEKRKARKHSRKKSKSGSSRDPEID